MRLAATPTASTLREEARRRRTARAGAEVVREEAVVAGPEMAEEAARRAMGAGKEKPQLPKNQPPYPRNK
jgi:electron transfer flavoprotein alpha/beta subunit